MKIRNKKTGEIVSLQGELTYDDKVRLLTHYNSLAELNAEWEDYEEPKYGIVGIAWHNEEVVIKMSGIEAAERMTAKLQALERLLAKGFEFDYVGKYENLCGNGFEIPIKATMPATQYNKTAVAQDLKICFGGEE